MARNYWTPERDEEMKRHKAAGLSASRIAALLHTTRNAVLGRTYKLRNRPSQAKMEQLRQQKTAAAEARKKARKNALAEKREKAATEARERAQALQDKIL